MDRVIVRTWDPLLQAFTKLPSDDEECAYKEGVLNMDFDSKLGCYPLSTHQSWLPLVDYID